jgi:predicted transcriptional regulator
MKTLRQQITDSITTNGLASEHIAGLIADVVQGTIGNGTIKALEEEIEAQQASLREAHSALDDLLCHPDGGTYRKSPKHHITVRNAIQVRDRLAAATQNTTAA